MQGKVATIYSLKDLEEKSQHNPYIVLFAYKKEDFTKKDLRSKHKIERIEKIIEKLANTEEYLMTGVRFAKANTDQNFWKLLTKKASTEADTENICFIIFEDGIIMENNSIPAYMFGEQGSANIKDFIEQHLGNEIKKTIQKMKEEQRKYKDENEEDDYNSSNTSINVYYPSYYDPYYYNWGYPWYSYGPGWGYGRWGGYRSYHNHRWHGHKHYRGRPHHK